jgi:uncharacterized membrane-anchored protein
VKVHGLCVLFSAVVFTEQSIRCDIVVLADVADQMQQVTQAQAALKESQAQLEQQQAVATQAEADAASESMRLEKETGAQYTEETIRALTEVHVQLQQAQACASHQLVLT